VVILECAGEKAADERRAARMKTPVFSNLPSTRHARGYEREPAEL
jgi:hypothetical protein